ncbi:hypothetical protein FD754_022568 [Muntiacus muntjak]|uniref:Immunoglobulin V-set domain-containing protein n=1 Tax=Muntiacus muntjak TaxID=9888 RepID=A0A5N3V8L7_MUNMU|nr:hypothetical protein FD754_022568 [Muntiacus muntjak]
MCLSLLCCVALFFWGAGSMDTEVTQNPSHLIKGKDEKAKMDCVPKEGHDYVYWYRKKLEEPFEFLVYFQNEDPMEETAVFKQRFSADPPRQRTQLCISVPAASPQCSMSALPRTQTHREPSSGNQWCHRRVGTNRNPR